MANLGLKLRPWAAVVATVLAGCHASGSTMLTSPLRVAAQPFALAEVARRVGGNRVVVADHGAVALTSGGDADPWLDPVAMETVTQAVAAQLTRADPAGRNAYQAGARAYQAQLGALDIDYRSSLADCARHDIVTADGALARTGTRYGFTDHAATDPEVAGVMAAKGIGVVFTEVGGVDAPIAALAKATGTRVEQLDTLTAVTAAEAARRATYISLMTDNLAKLRSALGCTSAS